MLLAAGCSLNTEAPANSDEDSIVLPPARIGESVGRAHLAKYYSFETAFSEADVVARIKIGNWLSEDELLGSTFFEATVLQCFKGDIPEIFILTQSGTASATLQGYPLFTYGNELLLFQTREVHRIMENFTLRSMIHFTGSKDPIPLFQMHPMTLTEIVIMPTDAVFWVSL